MGSKNILVTGGAGFIGSHTAKALSVAGFTPVVLDDMTAGNRGAVRWGPLIEGDIADEGLLGRIFMKYQIDAVIHLAASAYVGESVQNPRKYFHNNVTKGLSLLDTMLECGIDRLIFSSSCAIYGIPQSELLDENHPQVPINPYGETKLFFEKACHWYEQAHQLRSVCLRYFNAAGADPDGILGENHFPETHLIPRAIGAALGAYPELTIYGTDFPTPDGTAIRDYVHVSDVAAAHVDALRYLEEAGESIRLNLGTGKGTSVRQVIRAVEEVSGRSIRIKEGDRRPGDPGVLVACADRAKGVLGWNPKFRDIASIVSTAWNWELSQSTHSCRAVGVSCRA